MVVGVGDINWYDYISRFGLVPEGKKGKRRTNKNRIINVFTAFDIETSVLWLNDDHSEYDVHSFMYVWQFQIEEYTVKGRTWDEFFSFLDVLRGVIAQIKQDNNLTDNPYMVIWVHNLAYEWQWLSGLYPFRSDECFFRDVRKPIYCRMFDCFEYRCSYIQSNLSLSALCKQTGVEEKKSGQKFNYDKLRFPWTELTDFEEEYTTTDVQSLVQAMKYRVQRGGDTLVTVPLTSTGYVRRECKEALKDRYLELRSLKPDKEQYKLLRSAFRGGNTHANRYNTNKIVKNVYSYDISSSYPTQQLTHKFPMKPFKWLMLKHLSPANRVKRVFQFIGLGYAVVGRFKFTNVRLRNHKEPVPYISLSRCKAEGNKEYPLITDNGRILECGFMSISLTEIDLKILLDQYTFDLMDVDEAMVSMKDYLPPEYREVIQSYYNKKTKLKGDDTDEGQYMYVKSKNMLNSVYGMSATDPIHQEITYDNGNWTRSDYEKYTDAEIKKKLIDAPFPYQWGVYTCALARAQLQEAINIACKHYNKFYGDRFVYCDTDSIKVIGDIDLSELNDKLKKRAIECNAFADDKNGERHYIGVFEFDGHYREFCTQGSKRYAFIKDNGRMGITVAGVTKAIDEETVWSDEEGKEYRPSFAVEELGTLENFVVGMKWEKAGGTIAVYNDDDDFYYTDKETGRQIHITKNVSIVPSTYEMSYAYDYKKLLNEIELYGDYQRRRE